MDLVLINQRKQEGSTARLPHGAGKSDGRAREVDRVVVSARPRHKVLVRRVCEPRDTDDGAVRWHSWVRAVRPRLAVLGIVEDQRSAISGGEN